jgi:hypothetical protein
MKNLILTLLILTASSAFSQESFLKEFKDSRSAKWGKKVHVGDMYLFAVKAKLKNVAVFSIELEEALTELDIDIDIHKLNLERAVTSGDIDNHAVFLHRNSGRYDISVVVYKGRMNYFITK